jgi:hypothetical protein
MNVIKTKIKYTHERKIVQIQKLQVTKDKMKRLRFLSYLKVY